MPVIRFQFQQFNDCSKRNVEMYVWNVFVVIIKKMPLWFRLLNFWQSVTERESPLTMKWNETGSGWNLFFFPFATFSPHAYSLTQWYVCGCAYFHSDLGSDVWFCLASGDMYSFLNKKMLGYIIGYLTNSVTWQREGTLRHESGFKRCSEMFNRNTVFLAFPRSDVSLILLNWSGVSLAAVSCPVMRSNFSNRPISPMLCPQLVCSLVQFTVVGTWFDFMMIIWTVYAGTCFLMMPEWSMLFWEL